MPFFGRGWFFCEAINYFGVDFSEKASLFDGIMVGLLKIHNEKMIGNGNQLIG